MSLTYSKGMATGTQAPDFKLLNTDGEFYSLASFSDAEILIVVFTCNHCPYAIASEDRLIALQNEYQRFKVQFVLINPNDTDRFQEDSYENMKKRAEKKNFPFPYLWDQTQEVARAYDAACTPDVFVFERNRKLIYNGRIDDNWKEPEKVLRHDLRTVIEDVLAERQVTIDVFASMGCSIKWK
jgi:peroxiredoxin